MSSIRRIISWVLLAAVIITAAYLLPSKLGAFYYNQGNDYYDKGLYKEAIHLFQKSLRVNSSSDVAHYMLANAYLGAKLPEEAIKEYKKAIQLNPVYVTAYHRLAQVYWQANNYQEAIGQLIFAQKISKDNKEIRQLLDNIAFDYAAQCLNEGVSLFLSSSNQKAEDLLKKSIQVKPDFAYGYYTLGFIYFKQGNFVLAEEYLQQAVKFDPRFWPAYKVFGDIYFRKGLYKQAVLRYQQAIDLRDNNATLHNDIAVALIQLERYQEAVNHLEKASKLSPDNLNIRYSLASAQRDNQMFDQAASTYQQVIALQNDYPNVHNDLGDIYQLQGKDQEALAEYNKEIKYCQARLSSRQEDPILLNNLAYAFSGIKDYKRAKEIIEKVLVQYPDYRQAYLTLANIQRRSGEANSALASLAQAKKLSSEEKFIDRDIAAIKKENPLSWQKPVFSATDTIYLKNGRKITGHIKEEDEQKVILEVQLGEVIGNVTVYQVSIERINRG
jgi:tetratricopeptide (TPR) repeat protein